MPDGIAETGGGEASDRLASAGDARLIRDVRLRLVAWSGLTTLLVLAILGVALYLSAARTLADNGVSQLNLRASQIVDTLEHPNGRPGGPEYGFIFGGGTIAVAVDDQGRNLTRGPVPAGLPVMDSVTAAATGSGLDLRIASVQTIGPGQQPAVVPVRVLTQKATTSIGDVYIQVVQDRTAEQQTLDAILRVLLVGGAIVVLVAFGFGAIYARRALVPIRESLVSQRAALRRQREFAADASHELRTPLTVIRSSVEHLRRNRGEPSPTTTEALDDIDAEVGHLTALVEDLLLLARSDSGAITLARAPVDVGDIAADGAGALAKAAEARGVRLFLDPEPAIVSGDSVRLRQLIVILVDNAVRHSPRGGAVRVRVRNDAPEAVIEVEDDGPGIRPEDMPRVFERFWRAPGAAGGGTGLGLAIAKSIVDLHEGRITVTNRLEGGARFSVRLPGASEPPAAAWGDALAANDGPG
ncbi:MAG TPA: HAMP domain-containing sensor histidine kinase [Candidatus Limnocylindrales bacterium]